MDCVTTCGSASGAGHCTGAIGNAQARRTAGIAVVLALSMFRSDFRASRLRDRSVHPRVVQGMTRPGRLTNRSQGTAQSVWRALSLWFRLGERLHLRSAVALL